MSWIDRHPRDRCTYERHIQIKQSARSIRRHCHRRRIFGELVMFDCRRCHSSIAVAVEADPWAKPLARAAAGRERLPMDKLQDIARMLDHGLTHDQRMEMLREASSAMSQIRSAHDNGYPAEAVDFGDRIVVLITGPQGGVVA